MIAPLRNLLRGRTARAAVLPLPAVPAGERYYVIGDVHGRRDLFERLVDAIEHDDAAACDARTTVVLLGDLVDRGADSAGVVALARQWQHRRGVTLLAGNHEEMFLDSFDDTGVLRQFLRHGGKETVLSYGISPAEYRDASLTELQALMDAAVPAADRRFLATAQDFLVAGDYLFVHAGIAPGVPLAEQTREHFRWIREPFLDHAAQHDHVIVHGHTITEGIDARSNRIGIDTGAFRSGRLTALVLEGTARRTIQAVETDGHIEIETGELVQ